MKNVNPKVLDLLRQRSSMRYGEAYTCRVLDSMSACMHGRRLLTAISGIVTHDTHAGDGSQRRECAVEEKIIRVRRQLCVAQSMC